MKRASVLLIICLAIAAFATVRLWPRGGAERTAALSRITTLPRDVRGMPIFWLGDSYNSMQLTGAKLTTTPAFYDPRDGHEVHPAVTSYTIVYGDCTPSTPAGSCPVPLQIEFYGVCNTPPLAHKEEMPVVPVRGVNASENAPGDLWIETADFTVRVMAWGTTADDRKAHALQVVQDLVGANPEAAAFGLGTAFQALSSVPVCNLPMQAVGGISVGTPALVSGKVQVPVSLSGQVNVPYSAFQLHLRWDASVFTLSSANSTGSVLPSPFCAGPVVDADGAGAVYGCATTGSSVTATGLLATLVLTPAATGCSTLHLFTYGEQDHGGASTGTYLINAASNQPLPSGYTDGSANVSGQAC